MNDLISLVPEMKVPLIAIIGRPNVGKSTLFNRLIRKRRAITDSTPGVTRDPIFEEWDLEGHTVMLADTGGLKLDQEGLDYLVTEKSYAVLKKADVILLMMDITEVTPEDQTLIEALRPYTDKIILVVNKVDNPGREDQIWEFYSYGIKDVVGISSAHGLGIVEMEEALLEMIDFPENEEMEETEDEEKKEIRIAVMGKPNTGKSTLTNQLTGMESSIVSEIPGTTRDVVTGNFTYKGTDYIVLDTAGIRKKKKVGENIEIRIRDNGTGMPQEVIDKPPSAGLWEGQTDEGELGLSYTELDRYLVTGEASDELIRKIKSMITASSHKRRLPPIANFET